MIVRPYRANCDVAARGDPMTRNDHPARLDWGRAGVSLLREVHPLLRIVYAVPL
jgi:hypothetical protein